MLLPVVLALVIARFLIATMEVDKAALPKTKATHPRDKVTRLRVLLRVKDIYPKDIRLKVKLTHPRAIHNSSLMAAPPHPQVHQRRMVRPHRCHRAGLSNGIRTASDGSTLSKQLVARNGTLPRICPLVPMRHPQQAHPTCRQPVMMSAACSATPTATRDTTTRSLELPRTRLRRRRAILVPCSPPLVSEVSQPVPSLAINLVCCFCVYNMRQRD